VVVVVVVADHLSSSLIIELLTDLELNWVVAPSSVAAVAYYEILEMLKVENLVLHVEQAHSDS
jgi:hypothetical protein